MTTAAASGSTVSGRSAKRASSDAAVRMRTVATVLLAVVSGSTDAVGFLALGGAFTSVMTGNLVLVGISLGRPDLELLAHTIVAVIVFVLGCAVGTRLAGAPRPNDPVWPTAISRALCVEFVVLLGYAIGWWVSGDEPRGVLQTVLLALNALALGIQSSTVLRFGVSGLSTTYLTGTLTTLVHRLASGHRLRDVAHSLWILAALVAGAAAMAAVLAATRQAVPALQLAALAVVLAVSWRAHRRR